MRRSKASPSAREIYGSDTKTRFDRVPLRTQERSWVLLPSLQLLLILLHRSWTTIAIFRRAVNALLALLLGNNTIIFIFLHVNACFIHAHSVDGDFVFPSRRTCAQSIGREMHYSLSRSSPILSPRIPFHLAPEERLQLRQPQSGEACSDLIRSNPSAKPSAVLRRESSVTNIIIGKESR